LEFRLQPVLSFDPAEAGTPTNRSPTFMPPENGGSKAMKLWNVLLAGKM
jgi:hypothetical protein